MAGRDAGQDSQTWWDAGFAAAAAVASTAEPSQRLALSTLPLLEIQLLLQHQRALPLQCHSCLLNVLNVQSGGPHGQEGGRVGGREMSQPRSLQGVFTAAPRVSRNNHSMPNFDAVERGWQVNFLLSHSLKDRNGFNTSRCSVDSAKIARAHASMLESAIHLLQAPEPCSWDLRYNFTPIIHIKFIWEEF